jgi:hypothetical protein
MRLITEAVNPAHAIDQPAFDIVDIVFLRPFQAFFKRSISRVESVRVETDFHAFLRAGGFGSLLRCRVFRGKPGGKLGGGGNGRFLL